MTTTAKVFARSASRPVLVLTALAALGLAGCEHIEQRPSLSAGWSLLDASQRHPILVSQEPHKTSVRVSRNSAGLTPAQRNEVAEFFARYRAQDAGNSKVAISVPSGTVNEVAAMHAVADMRPILAAQGFNEASVSIEPYYSSGDPQPPVRISYLKYVAEGPECGQIGRAHV